MSIPRGHEHDLRPYSTFVRTDGGRVVYSRCVNAAGVPDGDPGCALEEERIWNEQTGLPERLRYRFNGIWLEPLDLLRMLPLSVKECPGCDGVPLLVACDTCKGVGVVDVSTGTAIGLPELRVPAA